MKIVLVALGIVAGAAGVSLGAPVVVRAEPADLVPYCTGDQTPANSGCRVRPSQGGQPEGSGSGLSPNLPYGLTPGHTPLV